MKPVKSTWNTYGRIPLKLGATLFSIALVFLILWFVIKVSGLEIWALVLGINSAVWLVLGTVFSVFSIGEQRKLNILKNEGLRYDAEITSIKQNLWWIRMGSLLSGYAECRYKNADSKACLVRSAPFILENVLFSKNGRPPEYKALVYVNKDNPKEYSVEISVVEKVNSQFDYDYR